MGLLDDAIREHLELKRRRVRTPRRWPAWSRRRSARRSAASSPARPPGASPPSLKPRSPTRAADAGAAATSRERPSPSPPGAGRRAGAGARAAERRPEAEPEPRAQRPRGPGLARGRAEPMEEPEEVPEREPVILDEPTVEYAAADERGRGRAGGDPGVPAGDAGARPAVVRAEAAARLRLRRVAEHRYTLLDVFTDRAAGRQRARGRPRRRRPLRAIMHAFARETRLSETSFVQSPGAARRRLPPPHLHDGAARSRSPAIRRSGPPPRSRAPAASATASYVQQTQPGEQAIDVELDGTARMLDAAGAADVRAGARSGRGARPPWV